MVEERPISAAQTIPWTLRPPSARLGARARGKRCWPGLRRVELELPNRVILGLVHYFSWLPPLDYAPFWVDPWLNLKQLIFPALITGYRLSAVGARMTRSSLLEVLRDDFVRTARAKGLREQIVVFRHALRNALLPVITIIGVEVLVLFGGLVVVETVFTIPGIGRFLVDAILHRDYPSIQALVFVFAVFVVGVNLLVDLTYAILDPRIRYT